MSQSEDRTGTLSPDAQADLEQLIAALAPVREDLPRLPQQARSREKRDELVKTAARLFAERGFEETTSDDIALAAGVSVGTFYKYFRNKRQILITIILDQIETIFSNLRLNQLDFSQGDYKNQLRQTIRSAICETDESKRMRQVWLELLNRDSDLALYNQVVHRQVLKRIEENLRMVAAKAHTWPDLDIEATSLLIFTLMDNIGMQDYETIGLERMVDSITNLIYRAIFPPETI